MDELDQLALQVRRELDSPPEPWVRAQRQRLLREISSSRPNSPRRRLALAGAALVGIIGLALWFFGGPGGLPQEATQMTLVAQQHPKALRLEDGSSVSLSPGARGRVDARPDAMRFDLQHGLVTFDVVPQRSRRFVVVAGAFEISVIGTRFSVRREPADAVEVRVEQGIVSVRAPGRSAAIQLEPGDRLWGNGSELALEHSKSPGVSAALPASAAIPSAREEPRTEVAPRSSAAATPPAPSADWEALYREGRYAAALALAKQQGFDGLLGSLTAGPLSDLADTARLGGDSELALRALKALERRFPASPRAVDVEFLIGRLHAARGESDAAVARFEKYLLRGGQARYAVEAMGRLVEIHAGRGNAPRARSIAEEYLERAPNGPYRRLCLSVLSRE